MVSVTIIKFLDKYIGNIICMLLGFLNLIHRKSTNKPKSILLIQFWGIGETILCLPMIQKLRKKYKTEKIDILVTNRVESVFYNNKNLSNIRVIDLNPFSIIRFIIKNYNKYDIVIDMEEYLNISAIIAFVTGKERIGYSHGVRSSIYNQTVKYNDKQHVAQTFMDLLKPLNISIKTNSLLSLNYSKKDEIFVNKILKNIKAKTPIIALAPGAAESSKIRMWPDNKWSELINKINSNNSFKGTIILLGAADVTETNQNIINKVTNTDNIFDVSGKTNVLGLFALISKVNLVISIDSGPMHVGAAQGVPTIGLFGPNTPARFAPLNKKSISIYKPVTRPVINVHKGEVPNTTSIDHMKNISVGDVYSAVKKIKFL